MTFEDLTALVERAFDTEALNALPIEEVTELRDQLQAGYEEFRPTVTDRQGLEALQAIVEAIQATQTRIDTIEAEDAALAAELEALDAAVAGPNDPEDPEGDDDEGAEPEPEPERAEEPERVNADAAPARRPSIDALRNTQRPAPEPEPVEVAPFRVVASAEFGSPNVAPGAEVSMEMLGSQLQTLHRSMQTLTEAGLDIEADGTRARAGGRRLVLGHIPIADRPGVVHIERGDGSEIIDQAVREHATWRDEQNRVVASGGDCVMALPDYSINVVGDRGTCFTDDLPTVAGNRPLTYYPWFKIDQSNGATGTGSRPATGIGFVTSEEDAAGYGDADDDPDEIPEGGVAYKSCIHIDCPDTPLTCNQEAVYKCVTIGNFQAISHPEYVNAFQQYMDVWWDIERDNRALDSFKAQAAAQSHMLTTGAADLVFGAVSSLRDIFHRLLAKERSARHAPNLSFNIVAPEWFGGFLALDVMRHAFGSLDNLRVTPSQALALASTDGIRISTYCTESGPATGAGTPRQVLTPITSGAVPAWPATVRLLMYADGAVFKKTAGDLQFGLRETLMKTNDFGMFQETFEKVCYRDSVYVLDVRLCANGATGAPVALVCT